MKSILKNYVLFFIITLIGLLLLGNIYLIDRNNSIIHENKLLQEDAERIKVNTIDLIRNIHFLDMTIRGYALNRDLDYESDIRSATSTRDTTYALLERMLTAQQYEMAEFYRMKDSLNDYFNTVAKLKGLIDSGHRDDFLKLLSKNKGYRAWLAFNRFSRHVNAFENNIARIAQTRYNDTLSNSYMLQVLLFFIIVPTLAYSIYYTSHTLKLTDQLRKSEADRNEILENQNLILEERVQKRTNEIQIKNEEIVTHNQQLTEHQNKIALQHATVIAQNHELQEAKRIIEEQSEYIKLKNDELVRDVALQTEHLQEANLELIEHNNRLEQFTYIISHNLRAPITRLVGLSNILNYANNEEEQKRIVSLIVKSTKDLDEVIVDLNMILGIQKLNTKVFSQIQLDDMIVKVKSILDAELKETHCELMTDFHDVENITSLPQYVESIFYNLISNAIKYRHPDRSPVIRINSKMNGGKLQINVADNGLGIDIEKNKHNIFNLYKRFHFHVEGKGLGLYLVKTQVMALGGTIDVQSKPNEGSVFTIVLDN